MSGSDLNLTCVAVGSPMPYVKWRKGSQDVFPEVTPPIGKNVLTLTGIQDSSNYTCVAASKLGIIERSTLVRVQGKLSEMLYIFTSDWVRSTQNTGHHMHFNVFKSENLKKSKKFAAKFNKK